MIRSVRIRKAMRLRLIDILGTEADDIVDQGAA